MISPSNTFGEEFRPARRNEAGIKCGCCKRVFAAGFIPPPQQGGRFDGSRLCRECRYALEEESKLNRGFRPLF